MEGLLALKLALAPLLTVAVTLASRRWGSALGGWLAGLPLLAGPVSLLFALQHGMAFAREAAHGTLLGVVGVCAFAAVYARMAERRPWPTALAAGALAFLGTLGLMRALEPGFAAAVVLLLVALVLCLRVIPFIDCTPAPRPAPRWDLPLRVLVVTSLTLAITALAPRLGDTASGLVSPIPVLTAVFAVVAHQTRTVRAVKRLLRGAVASLFGFGAFFVVVHASPPQMTLAAAYALALSVCLAVNLATYRILLRPAPAR